MLLSDAVNSVIGKISGQRKKGEGEDSLPFFHKKDNINL
jgi:hypothetical protein